MRACSRKAHTLLELLISSALLLLMLLAAYESVVVATRYHQKLKDSSQIQQETMTILRKLERGLRAAALESVSVAADGRGIVFVSAETDGDSYDVHPSSGALRWRKIIAYYLEGAAPPFTLVRREQAINSDTPPATPDLLTVQTDPSFQRMALSKQIRSIYFQDGVTTTVSLETQSAEKLSNGLNVTTQIHIAQ